jgi:glutamyl-tRNA synthetase
VGGARTALFNWLYARHHGGTFILRIEDTDLERSSDEMVQAITGGLSWLGIDWDEGPFHQAERVGDHRAAAEEMLRGGHAYRCFCDPAQLEADRLAAREKNESWSYDGTCRRLDPETSRQRAEAGEPFALRFRAPHEESVEFTDIIHGSTGVEGTQIEDFVIVRSDGQPTYQLAVVVDDVCMKVTHVIRGDDHLSNTPKQILLYRALGATIPEFAHLPLILGPDKKRLSKRHGATSVEEYREKGFMPEAVVNFLALLGWSPGDDREFLRRDDLIEAFDLDRVLKKASVFDETKLEWLNGQYLIALPSEELIAGARKAFEDAGFDLEGVEDEFLVKMMHLFKERVRTFRELPDLSFYFFRAPAEYDPESVAKRWKDPSEVIPRLERALEDFRSLEDWSHDAIETAVRGMAESEGVGAGKYIHPIRVAVSGLHYGPGLFEMLELLGRENVLQRLEKAIAWLKTPKG